MPMSQVAFFPGASLSVAAAGGKAAALMRLCEAGFDVPRGAVLTVDFFEPWFEQIRSTESWAALVNSAPEQWGERCAAVKAHVDRLPLSTAQQGALSELDALDGSRFAVRSSSPDEDLGRASFAGAYETVLGVGRDEIEAGVRRCFASSLDARILRYKQQHGFEPFEPRIAVIVQTQVDSEVAGVGFSLNPLTNDYDEAVVDASWGLGESVVSGAVSPDHFVVSKVDGAVLERELGTKATSLHLGPGGTVVREGIRSDEPCLAEAQLGELTSVIAAIEAELRTPVDVEFAYVGSMLHILQARPITAWVPLHESMQTPPGEHRRLFMDAALSGGLATSAPLSPIGESFFEHFAGLMIRNYVGKLPWELGRGDEVAFLCGGRLYAELSNVLWLVSPKMLARNQATLDALMAATLRNVDRKRYRSLRRPVWVSLRGLLLYFRMVWNARPMIGNLLRGMVRPRRARLRHDQAVEAFEASFRQLPREGSIRALVDEQGPRVITHVLNTLMAHLFIGMLGTSLARLAIPRRHRELGDRLERGFEGNVVVEMGVAMFRMSKLLSAADMEDPEQLARRLEDGTAPDAFSNAWDDFVARFGWRGPHEVDLGQPRYQDAPLLALRQVCAMGRADFDPEASHGQQVQARRDAYAQLRGKLGPIRRLLLRRGYLWLDLFAGSRDTPKHQYLMFFAAARARALGQGQVLVEAGRLDRAEDVMRLRVEDVERALEDPSLDLRALQAERTAFIDLLSEVVRGFPAVIDSRGRITRPAPLEESPGELSGMPISPGVVRGPAKILLDPHHKSVEPGEILIAYTTDPGWTPLFVNAAAVVLEVGGMLQHGAVVAREYGKPCVAGIPDLLDRFEDGEEIEVDGTTGVVRRVEGSRASRAP